MGAVQKIPPLKFVQFQPQSCYLQSNENTEQHYVESCVHQHMNHHY